jgi:hypothetical protein
VAGTAKHYVFNDGRKFYFDHAIVPVGIGHIKNFYGGSGLKTTRDKGAAVIAALQALTGPWRKRVLTVWKEVKPLYGSTMSLTEYLVRPNGSKKSCTFRNYASGYRTFKCKNPTKVRKPKPAAVAVIGHPPTRDGLRHPDWLEPAPAVEITPRNNRNPHRTDRDPAFARPVATGGTGRANATPTPFMFDAARERLQEALQRARVQMRTYQVDTNTPPDPLREGEL